MTTVVELSWRLPASAREADHQEDSTAQFVRLMAAAFAILIVAESLLATAAHLDCRQLLFLVPWVAALAALCCYGHWRCMRKLRDLLVQWLCGALVGNFVMLLVVTAGRTPVPLMDSSLARIDAGMHFSTAAIVHWISRFPALQAGLAVSYHLLKPLTFFALFVPALLGKMDASRRFVLSVLVAGIITSALFAPMPAAGPWVAHGYHPTPIQAHVEAYLRQLKSRPSINFDLSESGIVSFPSFHVVLAILSISALWEFRLMRPLLVILGAAICVSTVTTGWHYFIDVIGGFLVAAAAYLASERLLPVNHASHSK
jgi:membrane-associated phospholipid phosphatase